MGLTLFLDDDAERHIVFRKTHPFAMQTTSSVVAFYELRIPGHIDELWLDHDLGSSMVTGGFFDPGSNEPVGFVDQTVMPLVDWLVMAPGINKSLRVRIHSWNVPAARRMREKLVAAGFTDVLLTPFSFTGSA